MRTVTTVGQAWDRLIELGVSEDTLSVVANINGYNLDTMLDILYATTGYRDFEQADNE